MAGRKGRNSRSVGTSVPPWTDRAIAATVSSSGRARSTVRTVPTTAFHQSSAFCSLRPAAGAETG